MALTTLLKCFLSLSIIVIALQVDVINKLENKNNKNQLKLAVVIKETGKLQYKFSTLDTTANLLLKKAKLKLPVGGSSIETKLELVEFILNNKETKPKGWPTKAGWISSKFGSRIDPFTGKPAIHKGLDIANYLGAPVLSTITGIVVFTGKQPDFGLVIEVANGYGYLIRYAHLAKIKVNRGDYIQMGDILGNIGSSGRSTGPHLHYEIIKEGTYLNPRNFL